jgi:eukaryotic-like serine/threonine-protein kinase
MAAPSPPHEPQLSSDRYERLQPLGKGGAGAVFLALDRETGDKVALKKLFRMDHRSVQRFKREFRAIADLHHANLVKLYDLQRADDAWFLTMEYVEGNDLQTELHGPQSPARIARIARAFQQLALGVQAVHRAGMLHRDLKPSNVVVAKTGRVVVLDFGLVRELRSEANQVTLDGTVAGTPAYMAPEQAAGAELTPAADWYAFGVMLYETLSGILPISDSSPISLLRRKLTSDPEPLARNAAPRELSQLCMNLLHRDPQRRPDVDSILRVLESLCANEPTTEEVTLQTDTLAPTARSELFGREEELAQLRGALDYVGDNRSAIVHVLGTSGSGKTSLIEYFLDELHDSQSVHFRQTLVLRSRCYEREAMPFKALDGVVDALIQHLGALDGFEQAHALPSEIHALTQVFPAFERLRVVHTLLGKGRVARGDAAQIRRNAERALRELFLNVAKQRSLVLWIDDLHWGDLDSAALLQDWLKRPAEAPILIVLSYRSDEVATSSCLQQLVTTELSPRFQLSLSPLGSVDIQRLCEQRLGTSESSAGLTSRIVAEARGNPFLALQLTALAQAKLERGEIDLAALSVEELVLRTTTLLSEPARALLRVLAIAGRPLVPQLALGAAGVLREGRSHIHALQGLRLVRTRIVDGVRLLEVYHDRVREAIAASLSAAESQRAHERLLRAVEAAGQSDPSWLHALALGAGQNVLALRYGQLAAQIASSSLAFERSAELYASCLRLTDAREELVVLWNKLGLALARCRRGAQAADAYLKASEYANDAERVGLLQLAASHLLRSGRYEEGEQLVQRVMEALQIEMPSSRAGIYASIAWERARYALLARNVKPRVGIPLPADELRRGEFYGMVAVWTAVYAPLRAALFQARTLRMAFQYAESTQMARTLCLTATIECMSGTEAAAHRVEAQLSWAEKLAQEGNHPNIRVELLSARAACALLLGRLRDAIEPAYQADELYDKKSAFDDTGDYYHMYGVRTVRVGALQGLGRHKEAIPALQDLIAHARATDNVTTILQISPCVGIMEQVLDDYASARERLDWERARLPRGDTGILHVMHMTAVLRAATLTRDFDWAQKTLDALWAGFERSPVRRSAYLSYILHANLARFLLNRHVERAEKADPARLVRKCLSFLASSAPEPQRKPVAARLRARLAYLDGDSVLAAQLFQQSMQLHQEVGALDDAARERYALGCVTSGAEGDAHKQSALSLLAGCGIVNPESDLRAYYPELID